MMGVVTSHVGSGKGASFEGRVLVDKANDTNSQENTSFYQERMELKGSLSKENITF